MAVDLVADAPDSVEGLAGRVVEGPVEVALASPVSSRRWRTRLRLRSMLAAHEGGEACACDLTEPLALLQPTVSHLLKVLLDAGLVSRDKRGCGFTTAS